MNGEELSGFDMSGDYPRETLSGFDASGDYAPGTSTSVFGDFASAAQAKLGEITERFRNAPTGTQSSVGGSIFQALYSYGAGKLDRAREQAAQALLNSRTGQRFVGEVERQRMQQYMPWIIGGVILLLVAFFFKGR